MDKADQLIQLSVSESTLKGYTKCWEDFLIYCRENTQEPYNCDVPFVIKYLIKKGKHRQEK